MKEIFVIAGLVTAVVGIVIDSWKIAAIGTTLTLFMQTFL